MRRITKLLTLSVLSLCCAAIFIACSNSGSGESDSPNNTDNTDNTSNPKAPTGMSISGSVVSWDGTTRLEGNPPSNYILREYLVRAQVGSTTVYAAQMVYDGRVSFDIASDRSWYTTDELINQVTLPSEGDVTISVKMEERTVTGQFYENKYSPWSSAVTWAAAERALPVPANFLIAGSVISWDAVSGTPNSDNERLYVVRTTVGGATYYANTGFPNITSFDLNASTIWYKTPNTNIVIGEVTLVGYLPIGDVVVSVRVQDEGRILRAITRYSPWSNTVTWTR